MAQVGLQRRVDQWNAKCPIGTPVTFYPVQELKSGAIDTVTTSEAWVLGDHTPVVMVKDARGCVGLDWLELREQ